MKVVLLQDVPKLGRKGEVKDVADGFARNALIPTRKAVPATAKAIARVEHVKEARQEEEQAHTAALNACVEKLANERLTITAKANEDGTLFAAVSHDDLLAAVVERCGSDVKSGDLEVAPIKSVGDHAVHIGGSEVTVTVSAE